MWELLCDHCHAHDRLAHEDQGTNDEGVDYGVSTDHMLKCNFYSQGCAGGFSFQIARYSMENQLVSGSTWERISANHKDSDRCHVANRRGAQNAI